MNASCGNGKPWLPSASVGGVLGIYTCVLCPVSCAYNINLAQAIRPSRGHTSFSCQNFTAMPDTSSSRTPNLEETLSAWDSTLGTSWTILAYFRRSASLQERITLLAVLTCMYSQILAAGSAPDDPIFLMLEVFTRTSSHLEATRRAATTTRSRMETLWQEGSEGRAEVALLRLAHHGIGSSRQLVLKSFEQMFESWLQKRQSSDTENWNTLSATNTRWNDPNTFIPGISGLTSQDYLNWLDGERTILHEIGDLVSTLHLVASL